MQEIVETQLHIQSELLSQLKQFPSEDTYILLTILNNIPQQYKELLAKIIQKINSDVTSIFQLISSKEIALSEYIFLEKRKIKNESRIALSIGKIIYEVYKFVKNNNQNNIELIKNTLEFCKYVQKLSILLEKLRNTENLEGSNLLYNLHEIIDEIMTGETIKMLTQKQIGQILKFINMFFNIEYEKLLQLVYNHTNNNELNDSNLGQLLTIISKEEISIKNFDILLKIVEEKACQLNESCSGLLIKIAYNLYERNELNNEKIQEIQEIINQKLIRTERNFYDTCIKRLREMGITLSHKID